MPQVSQTPHQLMPMTALISLSQPARVTTMTDVTTQSSSSSPTLVYLYPLANKIHLREHSPVTRWTAGVWRPTPATLLDLACRIHTHNSRHHSRVSLSLTDYHGKIHTHHYFTQQPRKASKMRMNRMSMKGTWRTCTRFSEVGSTLGPAILQKARNWTMSP